MRKQRENEMFALVEDWQQSGLTQKAFCREHGLPASRFYYWLKKYKARSGDNEAFVPVDTSGGLFHGIEIRYPNGIVVTLPPGIGAGQLLRLIGIG